MDFPEFIFYRPSLPLRPYVRYYWVLRSEIPFSALTFPIACPQLIFHKCETLYIPELESAQYRMTVSGQVNFPSHLQSKGRLHAIVAVLRPNAFRRILGIPASALYNIEADGNALGIGGMFSELCAAVMETESDKDCIALIDKWLSSKLNDDTRDYEFNRITASLRLLAVRNDTTVHQMAEQACLCKKQFERVFFSNVGMMPKEYASVVRFQKALRHMQNGNTRYADIAYACGYADQSHFIREFRRFSGLTPAGLIDVQPAYSDLFTNPL